MKVLILRDISISLPINLKEMFKEASSVCLVMHFLLGDAMSEAGMHAGGAPVDPKSSQAYTMYKYTVRRNNRSCWTQQAKYMYDVQNADQTQIKCTHNHS